MTKYKLSVNGSVKTVAFKRLESICLRPACVCVCESQWLNRRAARHFIIKDMQNARVKLLTCRSSVSLTPE